MLNERYRLLESLLVTKFEALRNEIEALRSSHDLAPIQLRLTELQVTIHNAEKMTTEAIHRTDGVETLLIAKFEAIHNEIEALRLLKSHDLANIQLRFQDSKDAIDAALKSSTEAIRHAEMATEKRFETFNDFKSQIKDQMAYFMTRSEIMSAIKSVEAITAQIKDEMTSYMSRGEITASIQTVENSVALNRDQIALTMPRHESMIHFDRNEDNIKLMDLRIKSLETGSANLAGKMWMVGAVITFLNIAVSWYGNILPHH